MTYQVDHISQQTIENHQQAQVLPPAATRPSYELNSHGSVPPVTEPWLKTLLSSLRKQLNSFRKTSFSNHSETAHKSEQYTFTRNYIGVEAIVINSILPKTKGKIKLFDIFWPAKLEDNAALAITVGEKVRVIDRAGNSLIVQPIAESNNQSAKPTSQCQSHLWIG